MKIATIATVGAAALAAGIFAAAPAYADDPAPGVAPAPAGPTADPSAIGTPALPPGNDTYVAQLPNGESYLVTLAPEQPLPEGAEEDDEMVVFWW